MQHRFAFLYLLFFGLFINSVCGQSEASPAQESRFVKMYSKLFSFAQGNYDSVSKYSEQFSRQFTAFITSHPGTLKHSFKKLVDSGFCDVHTSADGIFRIYTWDTWQGGTQHVYDGIYQWQANGKVFTKVLPHLENDPGFFCSNIFTVSANDRIYYLPVLNGVYSNKDASQSVWVYSIVNGKLVDTAKLFKTKTERLNRIDVEFDFFSVVDRPERPLQLITYNKKEKIIYIPVVNAKEQVTNKRLIYQLKNGYFEYIGTRAIKTKMK